MPRQRDFQPFHASSYHTRRVDTFAIAPAGFPELQRAKQKHARWPVVPFWRRHLKKNSSAFEEQQVNDAIFIHFCPFCRRFLRRCAPASHFSAAARHDAISAPMIGLSVDAHAITPIGIDDARCFSSALEIRKPDRRFQLPRISTPSFPSSFCLPIGRARLIRALAHRRFCRKRDAVARARGKKRISARSATRQRW